jgi:hypothetical protein
MKLKAIAIVALMFNAQFALGTDLSKHAFLISIGDYKLLVLIDGQLYVETTSSAKSKTKGRSYKSWSKTFKVQEESLIVLRPTIEGGSKKKQVDLDGLYLTADFSGDHADAPILKFTKEPEKYSHWHIEQSGTRRNSDTFPLLTFPPSRVSIRRDDTAKDFYWTLSRDPVIFENPVVVDGAFNCFPLVLSPESKDKFTIQQFDPNDGK